jgi:hypothetical protein
MHLLVFHAPYENAWSKLQKKLSAVSEKRTEDERIQKASGREGSRWPTNRRSCPNRRQMTKHAHSTNTSTHCVCVFRPHIQIQCLQSDKNPSVLCEISMFSGTVTDVYFGGVCCFRLQGISSSFSSWLLRLWWRRQQAPPKTWVTIHQPTLRQIPEDVNLHQHHWEYLRSRYDGFLIHGSVKYQWALWKLREQNTVGYATTSVCYNEQILSIKSRCYNEYKCYNKRGRILVIMESSSIVFTTERLFMLFMCVRLFMLLVRESLFIVFAKEGLFMFSHLHVQCIKVKYFHFILYLHLYFWFCIIFFVFELLCWMDFALGCGLGTDYP